MRTFFYRKMRHIPYILIGLVAVLSAGCPVSTKARVVFTAQPDTGFADLSVQFHAAAYAVSPYVLAEKFRGEAPLADIAGYRVYLDLRRRVRGSW